MKESNQSYAELDESSKQLIDLSLPDNYYDYKLKGTVIHMGNAEAGHYYSYIEERDENGKWYEFNDARISDYTKEELPDDAFGGEYKNGEV